jgi:hypothetical protein
MGKLIYSLELSWREQSMIETDDRFDMVTINRILELIGLTLT